MQTLYRIGEAPQARVAELFLNDSLDEMEFDHLNESLLGAIDAAPSGKWVLDLTQTSYMGSAVLGLLVNLRQRIKHAHGILVLCGVSPQLEKILRACCMERLFTIVKTRDEAMKK
ncbi:MAG TPA: STAS domain-containing protein [Tepidisphaeraceae bacterium]|jgi:anti-anti-sigma factor